MDTSSVVETAIHNLTYYNINGSVFTLPKYITDVNNDDIRKILSILEKCGFIQNLHYKDKIYHTTYTNIDIVIMEWENTLGLVFVVYIDNFKKYVIDSVEKCAELATLLSSSS